MSIIAAILLAGQASLPNAPEAAADSITFEMIVGNSLSGWVLHREGHGRFFDAERTTRREDPARTQAFTGPAENYDLAVSTLARYRALAVPGAGCPVAHGDHFGFRLRWTEHGQVATATFTDSCGGIPTDFDATIAPVSKRIDALLAPPSQPPQ